MKSWHYADEHKHLEKELVVELGEFESSYMWRNRCLGPSKFPGPLCSPTSGETSLEPQQQERRIKTFLYQITRVRAVDRGSSVTISIIRVFTWLVHPLLQIHGPQAYVEFEIMRTNKEKIKFFFENLGVRIHQIRLSPLCHLGILLPFLQKCLSCWILAA